MFHKHKSFKKLALTALTLGTLAQPVWAASNIDKCQILAQPGSYQLVKDLTVTSRAGGNVCFSLLGSNLTLDLGGHTIRSLSGKITVRITAGGDVDATGKPSPGVGIKVRNGIVADFNDGVDLLNTVGALVEHLQMNINKTHGLLAGNGAIVRHGAA